MTGKEEVMVTQIDDKVVVNLVLLQNDLRLLDNPALVHAAKDDFPILVIYVKESCMGKAAVEWLVKSLRAFAMDLIPSGIDVFFHEGTLDQMIECLSTQYRIHGIYWNCLDKDPRKIKVIEKHPIMLHEYAPNLLFSGDRDSEKKYSTYRGFLKVFGRQTCATPLGHPLFRRCHCLHQRTKLFHALEVPSVENALNRLDDFWEVGESAAQRKWKQFCTQNLYQYDIKRDFPYLDTTSHLSPHLRFGEISVRHIWHSLKDIPSSTGIEKWKKELVWREFAYALWQEYPDARDNPMNKKWIDFPWEFDQKRFEAWLQGKTGYAMIDAGMRQLRSTGWMHNRVRMLTASFLVKNLLIPWQFGEKWFFDTLTDADPAINALNWQWIAGCGVEAAPYFHIFNPVLQAKKFDPEGTYVKTWVTSLEQGTSDDNRDAYISTPIVDWMRSRQFALELSRNYRIKQQMMADNEKRFAVKDKTYTH